jgi:hypothetical protein
MKKKAKQLAIPVDTTLPKQYSSYGTILEAAFVDPAYTWPPADGEGKNAIELQASVYMLNDDDSVCTTESEKERMKIPPKPRQLAPVAKKGFKCCGSNAATDQELVTLQQWELQKNSALDARKAHYDSKMDRAKELRRKNRYNRVPEGILIYRLDTATQTLTLMSQPHSLTDTSTLVEEMVVAGARPAPNKTRRGMLLKGIDGTKTTIVACEQRTAIAWMEAVDLMLANKRRLVGNVSILSLGILCIISDPQPLLFL